MMAPCVAGLWVLYSYLYKGIYNYQQHQNQHLQESIYIQNHVWRKIYLMLELEILHHMYL